MERARPGARAALAESLAGAAEAAPRPGLVILGASVARGADAESIAQLRRGLPGVPLVALAAGNVAIAGEVDALYPLPLEWLELRRVMERLLGGRLS